MVARKYETAFKIRVLKDLATLPNTWYVKVQQVSIRGTPDIICCIGSVFVGIELKRNQHAKLDPLQAYELGRISKAHGLALLCFPENWLTSFALLSDLAKRAGVHMKLAEGESQKNEALESLAPDAPKH